MADNYVTVVDIFHVPIFIANSVHHLIINDCKNRQNQGIHSHKC